jgi:hypothetical protein
VSWQEELRKLDEELASGHLSADDYRVRRDQVLSSAVTQSESNSSPQTQHEQAATPSAQGQSNADSTQVIQPLSPPQGFAQQGPGQQGVTQDPERTQAVSNWQAQSPPASPASGFPQQAQPQQPNQPQQVPWNAPDSDMSPPWGGSDLPPIHGGEPNSWVTQGPETFQETNRGGKGKVIGIALAILFLGGVALGAFLIWGTGNSQGEDPAAQPPASNGQANQTVSPSPPPDSLPIAQMPGTPEFHDEIQTFDDVTAIDYLDQREIDLYEEADAAEARLLVQHLEDGSRAVVLLMKADSPASAEQASSDLGTLQEENGAKAVSGGEPGVATTLYVQEGGPAQIRAHYSHEDIIARVEVTSPAGAEAAKAAFNKIIAAQLDILPADA